MVNSVVLIVTGALNTQLPEAKQGANNMLNTGCLLEKQF